MASTPNNGGVSLVAPASQQRWNVLALTILAQALIIGAQTFCFAFWVVPWIEEFHAPRSQLMLVISGCAIMIGLLSPIAGALCDRYPVHRIFCAGTLVFALCFVLMSFAESPWVILLIYAGLLPIGVVLETNLIAQILITRSFTANRGFAIGLSALGVSIGAFLMPPISTALLAAYGWRVTFRILGAAVLLILGPLAWRVLSRLPDNGPARRASQTGNAGIASPAGNFDPANNVRNASHAGQAAIARQTGWTTAQLLFNRDFWIIAGGFTAVMAAVQPVMFGIGSYARDLGIPQQQAAFAASLSAITFAIGKLSFGRLSDTVPHKLAFLLAAGAITIGITLISLTRSPPVLAGGLMLMTLGQGCVLPLSSSMVASRFGMRAFGQVLGLAWTFISMGSIAPFLAGLIRDTVGSYSVAFLTLAAPLPLAALAMHWLSRPRSAAAQAG